VTALTATKTNSTGTRPSTNWILALLTLPGAAAVVSFMYVKILGTAACSGQNCPHMGTGPVGFTLIQYGAPAVAVIAVAMSFFTARRPRGILVPVVAWVLLIAAAAVIAFSFSSV
jgi:hypothetical protein